MFELNWKVAASQKQFAISLSFLTWFQAKAEPRFRFFAEFDFDLDLDLDGRIRKKKKSKFQKSC